jgi:gliding motility-associated-like protein
VNAKINGTTNFSNVAFISAQEHDASLPGIAVVTKTGDLYTWGENEGLALGRDADNTSYNPGLPNGFTSGTDVALSAELGGHTLVYLKQGSSQFCYVGHKTAGSMGDNDQTDTFISTFNCSGTPSLAICGSVPISASTTTSTISANPNSLTANGTSTSVITVQLKQANGTNLTTTGGTVIINTNKGSIGTVTDNNDGTYTAILTSSTFNETANITYTLNGSNGTNSTTVTFIPLTPTITNTSNFSSFMTCVGTASAAQSFTVSAANLTSNLTVTAPTGFELATSSSGTYSSSIVLTQTSGTVSTTTLWARLKSSTLTSTSGSIVLSSTGATSGNISVSAQVSALPTISVNVIPDVTTSSTTFSIPFTGLTGADVYSLVAGTTSMTNFAAVSNASVTTSPLVITIPASAQNSYDFILTVANSTSGCSVQRTFSLVVSDINPGTTAADQAICSGTIPAAFTSLTDATAGGAGSPTYQWQMSTTGVAGTYNDINGATSASYSHPTALMADTYFRRKATIGVAFGTAHPIEVLVNALPVVTVSPSSSSITTGSSVTLTASGASTYSWSPSTGLSASNTAAVTATPTATTTYTVTGTNSTTSCSSTGTVTVTVNPALTSGTISADQTICVGATPATLTSSTDATGGTGSIVYEWQSSIDGTAFTTIAGATSSTYSPGAISVNTYFRRGASTSTDAVVYSSAILITVQQSVGGSIAGSATVCAGTNSTDLTLSGQTGSITKWQSSLTSNFASATDINNTTTTLTATNLSATTYYRAVIILGSCSAVNSSSASVTITALPSISVTPSSASITSGSSVTLTASGATTYSWSPSTGLSASNTAAVTATPTATTTYTVTGTRSSCSSTGTVTVTVTPANNAPVDTDGDGVLDTTETSDNTDPNDVCSYKASSQTLSPTSAWLNADCDGDGVTNGKESDDNTDPNDGCSYVVASKTLTPSTAWNALDCDGDGTPNGTDTAPKDPCVHAVGATPVTTNAIWRVADCDGDGVTNGKEADDNTNPNNGCEYKVASRTLTPSAAWEALDCDADGNPNSTDPNIDTPSASNDEVNVPSTGTVTVNILTNDDFLPGVNTSIERRVPPNDGTAKGTVSFNPLTGEMTYKRAPFESGLVTMGYKVTNNAVNPPVSSFAFVTILACDLADPLSDCDGDGELNGTDLAPTDPCVYEPSRQVKVNVSDDWKALDCDGDGVINGTELLDGTSASDACSFKGTSITLSPSAAWLLLDCDADGVTNQVEGTQDFDGDGIPNCLDTDSDGDSISDKLETTVDTDKDGKPDYLDLDSDNDGILDSVENKACTGTGILCDTDADGIPNFRDLDSDADQISDVIEASGSDYNKDGIADGNIDEKGIPSSANKGLTPPDTDRDGKLDPYDVDSDGDGILDFDEEYNEDADFADCDKDGIINRLDPDECDIFSPQGISPNGDGKNDRLVFKGLFLRKIPNRLSIFNRWGTLVFEMESYDNSFTGTLLPDGTYYYILDFFGKKPTISNYLSVDRTIK